MTVYLAFFSAIGALVIGTVVAVMRVSPVRVLQTMGTGVREHHPQHPLDAADGVQHPRPLYILGINLTNPASQTSIRDNGIRWAIVALSVYHAAFVCEALRSGVNTVPAGSPRQLGPLASTFGQSRPRSSSPRPSAAPCPAGVHLDRARSRTPPWRLRSVCPKRPS